MAYDFLPDEETPETKPNTKQGSGSKFNVGKSVFIDTYNHHLDAHALFSTPPLKSEFNLENNYYQARLTFGSSTIKNRVRDGFYGPNTDFDKLTKGYTLFQDPGLLQETLNKVQDKLPNDLFSLIEKPKLNINDRFGIFSFDLASMAMTYVFEYFKATDNTKVDANYVRKEKDLFFFIPTNEQVFQKIKRRANGSPVVVSSVRKSFIDFEKQQKQDRSVEIIILNSFSYSEKAKNLIYNSMAGIHTAKNLALKGFKVKLTALLVAKNTNNNKTYFHFVPAKRFNQPLDPNASAYVAGDPRFFRYQGFKMIISGYDKENTESPDNLGVIVSDKKIVSSIIEKDYVPNSNLKQADTRLYFGGSRSLKEVENEVKNAIEILEQKYSK